MRLTLRGGQFLMFVNAPMFYVFFVYGLYTGVESANWVTFDFVACVSSLVIGGLMAMWAAPFWDYQREPVQERGRHEA